MSEEEVLQAFERAPKLIQSALSDGPAIDFIMGLEANYSLHVDVAGKVVELIRNMLLGLLSPTQFVTELKALGLSSETAQQLVTDLNKQVFLPLRSLMLAEKQSSDEKREVIPTSFVSKTIDTTREEVTAAAPIKSTVPEHAESKAGKASPIEFNLTKSLVVESQSSIRTMAKDVSAVKEGQGSEYPEIKPIAYTSSTLPPQRTVAGESTVVTFPTEKKQPQVAAPIVKEYGSDPYREQI